MKYIDEFRNRNLVQKCAVAIREIMPDREISIMEVCGTHTHNFFRFGLDKLLPENLKFISGPGCPVCVSSNGYIDNAINLSRGKENVILTFADMLVVPGSISSLEKERAAGSDIRIVYSPLDAIKVARENPRKKFIFIAIGFETTAPTIALAILTAKKEKINNLFFFSSLKLIPPALEHIARDKRIKINGFLCPGHVSAIIGLRPYEKIAKKYGLGCCVSGFEPLDILEGIYLILRQIKNGRPLVENQYKRVVNPYGNIQAQKIIRNVLVESDAEWRGLGRIAESGLSIKGRYSPFDILEKTPLSRKCTKKSVADKCRCADILKGLIRPNDCRLFARVCTIDNPVGPCMVTSEGACNAYYKYHRNKNEK